LVLLAPVLVVEGVPQVAGMNPAVVAIRTVPSAVFTGSDKQDVLAQVLAGEQFRDGYL
jgi:hypothetical protein